MLQLLQRSGRLRFRLRVTEQKRYLKTILLDKCGRDFESKQVFKHTLSLNLNDHNQVDRASATETVDISTIPGRIKSKTIKIGIHSFPASPSALKGIE